MYWKNVKGFGREIVLSYPTEVIPEGMKSWYLVVSLSI